MSIHLTAIEATAVGPHLYWIAMIAIVVVPALALLLGRRLQVAPTPHRDGANVEGAR
jgi:hypothetical protein